jgi:hypothetical protein
MAKAASCSTTSKQNSDAELLAMIRRCDELWREAERLDEKPNAASNARAIELCREACVLEWKIVDAKVISPESLAAKIRAIRRAEFDAEDMAAILDRLAIDAERIAATR